MADKSFERGTLYDNGADYFELKGNSGMKFSAKGAKELCEEATKRNVFISRIEGGHWSDSRFRPDSTTTWDSKSDLEAAGRVEENNVMAIENVDDDASEGFNAFLITILNL